MAQPRQNRHYLTTRLLNQLSPEVRQSFTASQVDALSDALSTALAQTNGSHHAIDLRWSIPWPGRRFYIVLVVGQERRAIQAHKQRPLKALALFAGIALGAGSIIGLVHLQRVHAAAQQRAEWGTEETQFYPTMVPFKEDRHNCENSGREWDGQQCIDRTHDPNF